ncbi:MAG: hypothetical protein ACYC8T_19370 [Myxococcaceae bacterium]
MSPHRFLTAAIAALAGCAQTPRIETRWIVGPSQVLSVLTRHQCDRCHGVEAVFGSTRTPGTGADLVTEPVPLFSDTYGCAGCHRNIAGAADDPARLAEGRARFGAEFDGYIPRAAARYCNVPPLASMQRLRARWLRSFLGAPYDVRPNLVESMFRPNLTPTEVDVLLEGWGALPELPEPARPSPAQLARGAELFEHKSCGTCHLLGNRPFEVAAGWQFELRPDVRLRALAPDLQHARHRLTRHTVEAWIFEPSSVKPTAAMPKLKLTRDEAALLADFVYFADPGAPSSPPPRWPPPYDPAAPVPDYQEVEAKVFGPVCRHCHSNPYTGDGDRGPGGSGGFGFPGPGLSFAGGEVPAALLRPGPSGEPVILERLRARYLAPPQTGVRGMPLGLPALTLEQFSLVERWVKGAARPSTVSPAPETAGPAGSRPGGARGDLPRPGGSRPRPAAAPAAALPSLPGRPSDRWPGWPGPAAPSATAASRRADKPERTATDEAHALVDLW